MRNLDIVVSLRSVSFTRESRNTFSSFTTNDRTGQVTSNLSLVLKLTSPWFQFSSIVSRKLLVRVIYIVMVWEYLDLGRNDGVIIFNQWESRICSSCSITDLEKDEAINTGAEFGAVIDNHPPQWSHQVPLEFIHLKQIFGFNASLGCKYLHSKVSVGDWKAINWQRVDTSDICKHNKTPGLWHHQVTPQPQF